MLISRVLSARGCKLSSLAEKLYASSPSFLQSLYISLYGLKLYRSEYGRKFHRTLEQFEEMQFWSEQQIIEYQNQELCRLIEHCYQNVPYYRRVMDERKLKPSDIRIVDDLHKLPVLTKEDVLKQTPDLLAQNIDSSRLRTGFTSGTSGSPLKLFYDDHICLMKNVIDWRQKRSAGLNLGDGLAIFWGRILIPAEAKKPPFWRSNWVLNHQFFSTYHMSGNNLQSYVDQIEKSKAKALEGYPSSISILARYLIGQGRKLPLTAVFTSSETLFPHQRETIEEAFECRVFDIYGLAERTVFATECPSHEGSHFNMDFGITEILNRKHEPVPTGTIGRMVTTGLHNYGMPLIRYQTNDVTAVQEKKCTCGRPFPLMKGITSRSEDIVTTSDGRYLAFASLTLPFKGMNNLLEAQIIQESIDYLRIRLVRKPGYTEADSQYLLDEFKKRIGTKTRIEIEFLDSIPRTKSGKFRFVISKVPLDV